jgi:hypothetical protein
MAVETITTFLDNEFVRAKEFQTYLNGLLAVSWHRLAYKSADESVTNNTTQNDDHLFFTVGANELWYLDMTIRYSAASTTPDFKFDFTYPSDARWLGQVLFMATDGVTETMTSYRLDNGTAGVSASSSAEALTTENTINPTGMLYSVTGGIFQFRWAQVTTNASATTVKKGSSIHGVRVGANPNV